jgi:cytochrome c553
VRRALRALLLLAGPATAATAPPGAASCSGCHAQREGAAIPAIAGRPAGEIADRMLAYRRSEGAPTVMDRIAKGFSEEEIRAIAAWISAGK